MERGSLRKILNDLTDWKKLSAEYRHRLLHDIAEGMEFLHQNRMYHRDLKRYFNYSTLKVLNLTFECMLLYNTKYIFD